MKKRIILLLIISLVQTSYAKKKPRLALIFLPKPKPNLEKSLYLSLKHLKETDLTLQKKIKEYLQPLILKNQLKQKEIILKSKTLLEQGIDDHINLNFDLAQEKFKKVISSLKGKVYSKESLSLISEAHLRLAITYLEVNKKRQALNEFKRTLLLNPQRNLDPNYFAPHIINNFEEAKKTLADTPKVKIKFHLTPKIAKILLNGKKLEPNKELIYEIYPGEHILFITSKGFLPWHKVINISAETSQIIKANLTPLLNEQLWKSISKKRKKNLIKNLNLISSRFKTDYILLVWEKEAKLVFQLYQAKKRRICSQDSFFIGKPFKKSRIDMFARMISSHIFEIDKEPKKERASIFSKWWFWLGTSSALGLGLGIGAALLSESGHVYITIRR
jgi:tetratricopeptide (TPR) repeat protein